MPSLGEDSTPKKQKIRQSDLSSTAARSRNGAPPSVRHMDGSQLFVVRVWFERTAFRASARAVDCEENRVFDEPMDLLHFLCTAGGAPKPTRPPLLDEETT